MRRHALPTFALALAALSLAMPDVSAARTRHHRHHHHYRHYAYSSGCRDRQRSHANNGTIIGAIGGGIVGNSLARGNRFPGTALGAGVGALAGHAVGKNTVRC